MILSPPGFCLRSLLLGSAFLSSSFSVSSGEQVFIQLQNHPLPTHCRSPPTQIPMAPAIHLSSPPPVSPLLLITHPERVHSAFHLLIVHLGPEHL